MPKRKYASVSEAELQKAVDAVKQGKSQRNVCLMFGIPRGTLQNKVKGCHSKKPGHPTVLNEREEHTLVEHTKLLGEWGFPIDSLDLRMLVKNYLDKQGRTVKQFTNNVPGIDWYRAFLKRHKEDLVQRLSQNLAPKRAELSREDIKRYFNNLRESLKDVPPENIVNYDETNLCDDPGRKRCIFRRGTKYPERIIHSSKSATSLMFAGTASGVLLPTYVVYKAENLWDSWTEGGPANVRYGRSKSGWFEGRNFEDWVKSVAMPYFRRHCDGPKVLIGDSLSSHFSEEVIQLCNENNIRFVCLPPNATHMCQPLDVSFFRPLKISWRELLNTWKKNKMGATVSKDMFPSLLKQLLDRIKPNQAKNIEAGFKKCGIVPLDMNAVLDQLPEDGDPKELVSEVFMNHLKELRGGKQVTQKRKKKRLDVEPGKSVSSADTSVVSEDAAEDDVDDEQVEAASEKDDDQSAAEENISSPVISDIEDNEVEVESIGEGDYLLVKYKVGTKFKSYVGKVQSVTKDGEYSVMFMRKVTKSLSRFVYPNIADVDLVNDDQVMLKLPKPTCRRSTFEFGITLKGMFVQ